MSPPLPTQKLEVADFISLLPDWTTALHARFMKVWLLLCLRMVVMNGLPSCPHISGTNTVTRQYSRKGSLRTLKWKSPQSCQVEPAPPYPSNLFGGSNFLCAASLLLEHKLSTICLEVSLGLPLNSYLGESKNTNASNRGSQKHSGEKSCSKGTAPAKSPSTEWTWLDVQVQWTRAMPIFLNFSPHIQLTASHANLTSKIFLKSTSVYHNVIALIQNT